MINEKAFYSKETHMEVILEYYHGRRGDFSSTINEAIRTISNFFKRNCCNTKNKRQVKTD